MGGLDLVRQYPHLVVDTSLFPKSFQTRLLSVISDSHSLDEATDGLLIHSDNFQALNLLQARYREQVKCIYIDPPYNAKSSEILYKNSYKHSSFLTMIENRIGASLSTLSEGGLINIAIDDYEHKGVITICDQLLGNDNFIANVVVQHNPRGRNDDKFYGTVARRDIMNSRCIKKEIT